MKSILAKIKNEHDAMKQPARATMEEKKWKIR